MNLVIAGRGRSVLRPYFETPFDEQRICIDVLKSGGVNDHP
jgi:hypothetical protein